MATKTGSILVVIAALVATSVLAPTCYAQFSGGAAQPNLPQGTSAMPMMIPNAGMMPGAAQMSPQQLQGMMMMRALQGRGSHQVRTGIPNPIQMGPGPMMGNPFAPAYQGQQQQQQTNGTAKTSSSQKRIEARRLREEQKRSAKEAAAKKKKAGADKSAKTGKKAKDANAQAAR
jgi:hypothetical protein